jgi:hypothetical protein
MPSFSQWSRTSSDERLSKLYSLCTETIVATLRARSTSATVKLETPMCRISPARCASTSGPSESSSGTFGSVACSWYRSMRSSLRRFRLPSIACLTLGPAVLVPAARLRPHQPALGGDDEILRIGMQRFGDQLFVDMRAIGIGGVEEIGAEFVGAPKHGMRILAVPRWPPHVRSEDTHGAEAQPVDAQVSDFQEKASSNSASRASKLSLPEDRRTSPSSMPRPLDHVLWPRGVRHDRRISIRLSTPPRLSVSVKSLNHSRNALRRRHPALQHGGHHTIIALAHLLRGERCCGWVARPG